MKVNKLITYEGNKNEFKKYNEILKKQFDGIIFYYDNKIKKISEIFITICMNEEEFYIMNQVTLYMMVFSKKENMKVLENYILKNY